MMHGQKTIKFKVFELFVRETVLRAFHTVAGNTGFSFLCMYKLLQFYRKLRIWMENI
jgi:hypothetical protein